MTSRTASFTSAIYSDLPLDKIYLPEQLLAANSWCEPSLNDLQVGDEAEVWSDDGTAYKGILAATVEDVKQFRKLEAAKVTRRIYSMDLSIALKELTDEELEAILIHRGLNS